MTESSRGWGGGLGLKIMYVCIVSAMVWETYGRSWFVQKMPMKIQALFKGSKEWRRNTCSGKWEQNNCPFTVRHMVGYSGVPLFMLKQAQYK